MTCVPVTVPHRSYDVLIESGMLRHAGMHLTELLGSHRRIFVVTPPPVRRHWGKRLMASLTAANLHSQFCEMPDGEPRKRLTTVERLAAQLARYGADRDSAIVAFGGGVTGDVAGFLASIYMRGVDVVQIPTTVLAQVDASIGGKTGVNLVAGKNLVGTFYQPRAVLIDPEVLSTLPEREFRAGFYESLKCGVIGNKELFERICEVGATTLRRDPQLLEWVITESVKLKAKVVVADERESGLRQVLNFGHTIGHALEAQSRYRRYLHGEAVAWGMLAETNIAAAMGKCDASVAKRISDAVLGLGPLPLVKVRGKEILKPLKYDKKNREGKVHFALPRRVGEIEIVSDVPDNLVIDAVDQLRDLGISKPPSSRKY